MQKKVRISDQVMKPTSFPQTAIFVYFIGAHVSGIWVLGKRLTNQAKVSLADQYTKSCQKRFKPRPADQYTKSCQKRFKQRPA